MVRNMLKEELGKHEKSILAVISGNWEMSMKEIRTIKQDVSELKKSLEFTQADVEDKMAVINEKVKALESRQDTTKQKIKEIGLESVTEIKEKLAELEDRSRRNNLRVDGISEDWQESWDQTKQKVKNFIKNDLKMDKEVIIQRAHRVKSKNQDSAKPRTIVFLLRDYEDKESMLKHAKNLKGTNKYLNEDFCKDTIEVRKALWAQVKELRSANKRAFLQYRSVIVKGQFEGTTVQSTL